MSINIRSAQIELGPSIPHISILGTPISMVCPTEVLDVFSNWIGDDKDRYVVFRDVHGVVHARTNEHLNRAHMEADLVAPDGMPLVWALRASGAVAISRVSGPDLLPLTCEYGLTREWRHFFYGGAPGVADTLVQKLSARFPGLIVVGTHCPPFRPLTMEEDQIVCAGIKAARPDFIWVGLGTPKQEIWMLEHRGRFGGATMLGVGAAFDFHAGRIDRAPLWMQRSGLEWLHRLIAEPSRLWRRYIVLAPIFVVLAVSELILKRIELLRH